MEIIKIERKVLAKNDAVASENRKQFEDNGVFAVNMVSSPGSGKTSLVEKMIQHFGGRVNISVIEGDVQTDLDAQRVGAYNVPVVQIITNGGCHLEANLVRDSLESLDLVKTDLLIIENVGNLVCPAGYDLGEDLKMVVISVTEGDDKPLKYPKMFMNSSMLVINKVDLLPYVNCNIEGLKNNALKINPNLKIFETSCTSGAGIKELCDHIEKSI